MGDRKFIFLVFVALLVVGLAGLAFAAVTVTRTDFTTNAFNFNEDISIAYNITINNTVASLANGQVNNITQINITLPSGFVLLANSTNSTFGSGSFAAFSIFGSVLSWLNSSEGVINASIVGTNQTFGFNATALTPGVYNITVVATNWTVRYNSNLTVRINDTTVPVVSVANITLPERSNVSGIIILNVSVVDNGLINTVLFNITNTSGGVTIVNSTNPTSIYWNSTIDTRNYADGVYNLTILANDTFGSVNHTTYIGSNLNNSARVQLVFDNTAPTGSVSCTPTSVGTGETVTCSCSGSDALSGVNSTSITANPSTSQTGTFTSVCTVIDRAGNIGSPSGQYTVNGGGTSSAGSGSGSGTTTWTTHNYANQELSDRGAVSKEMGASNRISVKISGETHHVGVVSLSATSAEIEVSSTPQKVTMSAGETKKFDVTNDNIYDMKVTLVSISNNRVNLNVEYLQEAIPADVIAPPVATDGTADTGAGTVQSESGSSTWIWVTVVVIILVVLIVWWTMKRKSH